MLTKIENPDSNRTSNKYYYHAKDGDGVDYLFSQSAVDAAFERAAENQKVVIDAFLNFVALSALAKAKLQPGSMNDDIPAKSDEPVAKCEHKHEPQVCVRGGQDFGGGVATGCFLGCLLCVTVYILFALAGLI